MIANRCDSPRGGRPGSGHAHTHHTDLQRAAKQPTRRQLAYLKVLADRAGQTFTYPITREEASLQIARLKRAESSTRTERRVERKVIADAIATGSHGSTRVRDDELVGYGSSATWAQNQETEPVDPAPSAARRMTDPSRASALTAADRERAAANALASVPGEGRDPSTAAPILGSRSDRHPTR